MGSQVPRLDEVAGMDVLRDLDLVVVSGRSKLDKMRQISIDGCKG